VVGVLYLATASTANVRLAMQAGLLGQMVTPLSGNRLEEHVPWALDNGCFSDRWSERTWRRALERHADTPGCLFAVVPDVVANATATDELWERWAPVVHEHGYRAAYVLQNGCDAIPPDADAVFTGGDTTWKLGGEAQSLIRAAQHRGLWCHMGRVNTLRRLRLAAQDGYDSVDGTYLKYGPDINLPRLLRYLRQASEPTLFDHLQPPHQRASTGELPRSRRHDASVRPSPARSGMDIARHLDALRTRPPHGLGR
jgi:hypothetical protein